MGFVWICLFFGWWNFLSANRPNRGPTQISAMHISLGSNAQTKDCASQRGKKGTEDSRDEKTTLRFQKVCEKRVGLLIGGIL